MRRGWKRGGGGPSARIPTGPRALAHVAAERGGGNLGSGLAANTSGGGSSSNGWGQSGGWGESPEGWGHAGWGDSTSAWGSAGELNTSAAAPSGQGYAPRRKKDAGHAHKADGSSNWGNTGAKRSDNTAIAGADGGIWGGASMSNTGWGDASADHGTWGAASADGTDGWGDANIPGWGASTPQPPEPSKTKTKEKGAFSFGPPPPLPLPSNGTRSRTASISGASSATIVAQPPVSGSTTRLRSASCDEAIVPTSGPFASLLDSSSSKSRRATYSFKDPTLDTSGDELQYPDDEPEPEYGQSWKAFTKSIYKAVSYQQDLTEANELRDKAKRMAQTPRYQRIGDAARHSLDRTCAEYRKRAQHAERGLDDAINTLAKYPLLEGPTSRGDESIDVAALDVDRLKEYMAEVKEWMSLMREQMHDLQQRSEDTAVDPSVSSMSPGESEYATRLTKVEEQLNELETYLRLDLGGAVPDAIRNVVEERVARYREAVEESAEAAAVAAAQGAVNATQAKVAQEIHTMLSKLATSRADVKALRQRDHQWMSECLQLRVEQEALRGRLTMLEQARADNEANTRAIADLQATFKHLTARQRTPPPPPTMDELCAQVLAHLQPACQAEMTAAVTALKESVLQHAQSQEDHLYEKVSDRLEPKLAAFTTLIERVQKMWVVDTIPPPAVAQLIPPTTS